MVAVVNMVPIANNGGDDLTICLPGILARAKEQFHPIAHELPGQVMGWSGTEHHDLLTGRVASTVASAVGDGRRVHLVGASMGGIHVPFVINALPDYWLNIGGIGKIILVDAPTGAETMTEIKKREPFSNLLASLLASRAAGSVLSTRLGDKIVGTFAEPPKLDEITVPDEATRERLAWDYWAGTFITDERWKQYVMVRGEESLQKFTGEQWWRWMSWMIKVGRDGSLARACESLWGLDVTYMSCTHPGNGVVMQPEAATWYRAHIPGIKVMDVVGTHCGFLQNQPEFADAFRAIFREE